jgi:2-hydroxycyclohexanecarboxyl-CoA dehydrogenase
MLDGKTAIVTGAGQGLGRAIATVLAERGVSLVVNGRVPAKLESLQEEIRAKGGQIEIVPGDVGSRYDVARLVDCAVTSFGGIDILVNNAQTTSFNVSVLALDEEALKLPFRSGLLGTLYCMQACYPHLKARGGGSIVNFGSSTALSGDPGFAAYIIAKEGIRGLSRIAAQEWGPDGIRVNVICPAGLTDGTREWMKSYPLAFEQAMQGIPLRRIGDPMDDIGRAVAALADDDLGYLTGATLMLDGGHLMIN